MPYSAATMRGTRATGAAPWWMAAGIAPTVVYQPKGAASLAASYVNLANPGVNNAAPGVAPTWAVGTGWTFNGTTQYLLTGLTPANGWSCLLRFENATGTTVNVVAIGSVGALPLSTSLYLMPRRGVGGPDRIYAQGGSAIVTGRLTSGVMAVSGQQGYLNGVADGAVISAWSGAGAELFVGAFNNNGGGALFFMAGDIVSVLVFNSTLSAAQVLILSTAMAAL